MSFPRYPTYKPSGVEWLGEVPGHWTVTRLGRDLPESPRNGVSPDVAESGSRPSFSTAAVDRGLVDISAHLKLVELDEKRARPFLVAKGDLLLLRGSGSKDRVGSAGLVFEDPPPGCVYPDILIRLRMGAAWAADYGVLLLNSGAVRPQMELAAQTAAGIWKVSGSALRDLVVPRPPAEEQRAIASFLDRETARIDALVSEQEHLIELLREKRQAVISHAVTKGLDPNVPVRDSGVVWLGEVPAHWHVWPLKRDLDFLTSGSRGWAENYADEGDLFIRIMNLTRDNVRLDLSDVQRVVVPAGSEGSRTRVCAGDVLFSITAFLGSVAVVPDDLECAYVSQHVALARLRQAHLTPNWVAYAALSIVGKTWFDTQSYGGTKIQLSLDDVRDLPLPVPPIAEQREITRYLEHRVGGFDTLVTEATHAITLLQERRSALITAAVTGQIDVRGLA